MLYTLVCVLGLLVACNSFVLGGAASFSPVKLVSKHAQISERIVLMSQGSGSRGLELRGGASKSVLEVSNTQQLDKILADAGKKLVVLDFTASWCGPCRMIAPIYEQLSQEYSKTVFTKVIICLQQYFSLYTIAICTHTVRICKRIYENYTFP